MKDKGLKLILDFVPNHSSAEHEWFQKSVEREEPYTDFYIWKKPKAGGAPNNWVSYVKLTITQAGLPTTHWYFWAVGHFHLPLHFLGTFWGFRIKPQAWDWPTISLLLYYYSSTMIETHELTKSSNLRCRDRSMSSPDTVGIWQVLGSACVVIVHIIQICIQ